MKSVTQPLSHSICVLVFRTCKVFNIGTVSKRLSYILRFLNADFNKIRRNVCLSIAHNCPTDSALIVAALQFVNHWFDKIFNDRKQSNKKCLPRHVV